MELKKGYKQTEVGVIPEDWLDCTFEDVLTGFSSGQTPYRAIGRYYNGNIPWITSGELNYNIITDTIEKITKEAVVKTNLKIIPKGTFLFAITGLEAAGTRGSCAITGIEATTNQSCMALYPKRDLITTDYLFQFYVKYGDWLALQYCQGTKQQSYTGRIAKRLPIVVPPTKAEQTAIATALSDTDALITRLETLIAKKRAIKQGAMQQLLKPKEGWVEKKLGEIGEVKTGNTPPTYDRSNYGDEYFFVSPADLGQGKFINDTEKKLSSKGFSLSRLFPKGSILYTCIGSTIGKCGISTRELTSNQQINAILPDNSYVTDFLYYTLDLISPMIKSSASEQAVPLINKTEFETISIPLPNKKEQTRIAQILSDVDAEIVGLEQKLAKYKRLKQGMMQELLTGKTRLV